MNEGEAGSGSGSGAGRVRVVTPKIQMDRALTMGPVPSRGDRYVETAGLSKFTDNAGVRGETG